MHKAVDEALRCTHPGRRWKRKYKRAKRAIMFAKGANMFEHAMKYKECPMRNRGHNCDLVGGDCATGISDELCEAIHAAYNKGFQDGANKSRKEQLLEYADRDTERIANKQKG